MSIDLGVGPWNASPKFKTLSWMLQCMRDSFTAFATTAWFDIQAKSSLYRCIQREAGLKISRKVKQAMAVE